MKYLFSALVLSLGLAACLQREIPYPIEYEEQRQVLNAILIPNQSFRVHLSSSIPPVGSFPTQRPIEEAMISVYEDGQWLTQLQSLGDGWYQSDSNLIALADKKYRILSEVAGYQTASSQEINFPHQGSIIEAIYVDSVLYKPNLESWVSRLSFRLASEEAKTRFYRVEMRSARPGTKQNCLLYGGLGSASLAIPQSCLPRPTLAVDSCENGESLHLDYFLEPYFDCDSLPDSLTIVVYSLNSDLFRYYDSSVQDFGTFDLIFTTPASVYSNIEGGFGIIGAQQVDSIRVGIR